MKTDHAQPVSPPSRVDAWRMFDRLASRYDLLNHLLSFRQDIHWRQRLVRAVSSRRPRQVLDVATGTADVLITLCRYYPELEKALGIDLAENMLVIGRQKVARHCLDDKIEIRVADALDIPMASETFEAVTIAFGIRNVLAVEKGLEEMFRILKPGGVAYILEFSLPESPWLRRLYLIYLRHVLPRLGALVSGDAYAYRYLNQTIEKFPYGPDFCCLMEATGFIEVQQEAMTGGIVTLYQGTRPC